MLFGEVAMIRIQWTRGADGRATAQWVNPSNTMTAQVVKHPAAEDAAVKPSSQPCQDDEIVHWLGRQLRAA